MDEKLIKEKAASAIVSEAEAVAKNFVDAATRTASRMTEETAEDKMTRSLTTALREVFEKNGKTGRFIDVSRIPLICQNIEGIHQSLKEIKENMINKDAFWPVKTIVYSGVGLTLVAVVTGILALIIKQPK